MQTVVTRMRIVPIAVGVAGLLAAAIQGQTTARGAGVRAVAQAATASAVEVHERFTPDRLSSPTNLSLTANFLASTGAGPEPVRGLTVYAPAGLKIDARGAGTCSQAALELRGPPACPATARAGFGGGVGVLQLPREAVRESFTLDFFFASTRPGRVSLLVYASGDSPVIVERIVVAHEVQAPSPYGLGFSVEVPAITLIPGAPPASIESVYASLGAANVAYYKAVHGHRRLVHVRGLLTPSSCPAGGFPARANVDFVNGQSLILDPVVPCPAG